MITIPQPENFDTECLLKGSSILLRYYPDAYIYSEGGGEYYLLWTDNRELSERDEIELKELEWKFSRMTEEVSAWKYDYGWYLSNQNY
jgi:hypothetical protein